MGYTQSLNFLAAFLLLQLPARAAFWLLECVIERLLPSYFTAQLTGVLADTRTLDALVASHPQLHALPPHLESLGLDLSLVSTQWLMLGFVTALPSETAPLRLWGVGEWLVQTGRLVRRRAWT
uniref:Rab-GAP TBC domain-containing protein n=1 Tax=Emiliania huxleyi (strain CCMP1516) TaxID=280463 RepID=A0A0D3JZ69_EMIH1